MNSELVEEEDFQETEEKGNFNETEEEENFEETEEKMILQKGVIQEEVEIQEFHHPIRANNCKVADRLSQYY